VHHAPPLPNAALTLETTDLTLGCTQHPSTASRSCSICWEASWPLRPQRSTRLERRHRAAHVVCARSVFRIVVRMRRAPVGCDVADATHRPCHVTQRQWTASRSMTSVASRAITEPAPGNDTFVNGHRVHHGSDYHAGAAVSVSAIRASSLRRTVKGTRP
jgi:hypothetical protein